MPVFSYAKILKVITETRQTRAETRFLIQTATRETDHQSLEGRCEKVETDAIRAEWAYRWQHPD